MPHQQPNHGHGYQSDGHHVPYGHGGMAAPHQHQPQQVPHYGSTIHVQSQPQIIIIGGCPRCHVCISIDESLQRPNQFDLPL